jgi:hypothetical protein
MKRNKVSTENDYDFHDDKEAEDRKRLKMEQRAEFEEKLEIFKFYLAGNFFEDNIGTVEINTDEDNIITTTF